MALLLILVGGILLGHAHAQTPLTMNITVKAKINGQEQNIVLPVTQRTWLWKGVETPRGTPDSLTLRDNHFAIGLAQVDLSSLPKDAEVEEASLNLAIGYAEKQGTDGTISCCRILTPWTADAGWSKPDPKGTTTWDGLAPDRDFANPPFASFKIDSITVPSDQTIPGFGDAVKAWRDGTWGNYGFVLMFNGAARQINVR